jgi:hypothetical protein
MSFATWCECDFILTSSIAGVEADHSVMLWTGRGHNLVDGLHDFGDLLLICAHTISISEGNPALKPRDSDNSDLAAEGYLSRDGLVSVGVIERVTGPNHNLDGEQLNNGRAFFTGFTVLFE